MEWFVITEEEHLGPFEEDTLISMYEKGEITGDSFVWQEGWEEAVAFSDVFEDDEASTPEESQEHIADLDDEIKLEFDEEDSPSTEVNLPFGLPPIPTEEEIVNDLKKLSSDTSVQLDTPTAATAIEEEAVPVVPELEVAQPTTVLADDDEFEGEFAADEDDVEEQPSSKKKIFVISFLLIIALAIAGFFFFTQKTSFIRPSLMTLKDYERLKETSELLGTVNQFSFALSKDKKSIWIATNNPLSGEVLIKLKGKKSQLLGEAVEVKGRGKLMNHLIELKNFNFIVGSRLIDGIYDVSLQSSQPLSIPLHRQAFHENNTNINFTGKVLISNLDIKSFKKQLQRFLKRKFHNSKSYWQEIIQKYQTVKMITDQIKTGFDKLFVEQPAPWPKRILNFETQYRQEWGQFFTEFVKANEASYEKLAIKKFDDKQKVLASYNNLSNLAIKIGEIAMIALEKLQAFDFKNSSAESVKQLNQENSLEFVKIMESCEAKARELSE